MTRAVLVVAAVAVAADCPVGLPAQLIYLPPSHAVPAAGRVFDGGQDVQLLTSDGLTLGAWYVPAKPPGTGITVLVANGNAGSRARGTGRRWPRTPPVSPAAAANPGVADLHRETRQRNNEICNVVVSDSLTAHDTAPWTDTTTIVRRAEAHQAVAELKKRPGKDILVFGSRTLWNDLLVAGLVDELHLMVGAAFLAGGTPAFGNGLIPRPRLLATRRRNGSDPLLLQYKGGQSQRMMPWSSP